MKNNEYTATPNWFGQESTENLTSISLTNYHFGDSGNSLLSSINLYNKYIIDTYKLTTSDLFISNTALIAVDSELPEDLEQSKYFVSEVGTLVSAQDWHTSYLIRVISGTTIKANLKANTLRYGIVFYDEHNIPISGYTPTEDNLVEISVPEAASYFKCCHYVDPESESDSFYIEYQSVDAYNNDLLNEAYSGIFEDFTQINSDISEGIYKSVLNNNTLNIIFQQPLEFTTDETGNIKVELNSEVLKNTILSTDFVTTIEDNPLNILSLKDFKKGLKINGIEIIEKNGFILIKGNLATTGSITTYTEDSESEELHVSGNILTTGGGTFYSSDERAKTIIEKPKFDLKSIANSPIIKFKWNGYNNLNDDNKLHIGGIAQYIEKILPECVIGREKDFLSFDYATVGYIFSVQTARHLLSYETKLDKKIQKLNKRITYLEKQLKELDYEKTNIMVN